jgi:hypothetical protein
MSRHHHHQCPREQDEVIDRILRSCCPERRPLALLPEELSPEELSPEEVRRLRCFFDSLYNCICRPISNFDRVEAAEETQRRRRAY